MTTSALPHLFQEELYRFSPSIVVVLPREWSQYTPGEQLLLRKILTSVKVDMNSVQMVVQPSLQMRTLQVFGPARVLIFGSESSEAFEKYQLATAQGFTVIRADDLSALDDQKKKNLWIALRQMFGI